MPGSGISQSVRVVGISARAVANRNTAERPYLESHCGTTTRRRSRIWAALRYAVWFDASSHLPEWFSRLDSECTE